MMKLLKPGKVVSSSKCERMDSATNSQRIRFKSSEGQFSCSDDEIDTLASQGFTYEQMYMTGRYSRAVEFVRCPKRVEPIPASFLADLGASYELLEQSRDHYE